MTTTRRSAIIGSVLHKAWISSGSSWRGGTLVEVEIPHGRIERPLENRPNGLVLEHVLRSIEVIDRGQLAFLQRPESASNECAGIVKETYPLRTSRKTVRQTAQRRKP